MEKLIQSKDPYLYALENLKEDPDWGFLYSFAIESLSREDIEASRSFPQMHAVKNELLSKLTDNKLDPIDRFQNVIELKKESFRKAKKSSYENWEKKIAQFCISMHQSVQRFYYRKALTFREILLSSSFDRDPMVLLSNTKMFDPCMEEIALGTWIFSTLPGSNPTTNWPLSLNEFYPRLANLKPLALWAEPFDESNTFQDAAYQSFLKTLESLRTQPDKAEQTREYLRLTLLSILNVTLNSGSYDRTLSFIDFLSRSQGSELEKVIHDNMEEVMKCIKEAEIHRDSYSFLHYLRPDSYQGSFKMARTANFNGQKGNNCSLATDGTYLYIFVANPNKGCMYKIGTGEHNTISGKVYLFATTEKETDGCWVYCKGKLYLRRTNEDIGIISVICPETFKKLGTLKLCCEDAFKEPATLKFNKSMPLITNGDSLFIVTMQVKTVKKKLKPEKQEEFEKLKKDEEESKRKEADKAKAPPAKKTGAKDVKKEEKKQPLLSDTARICEFTLVEFDVEGQKEENDKAVDPKNESLIEELYMSFSGFFTKKECGYALRINKNDIQNAAHWLVDEGENERGKIAIVAKNSVLLAQSIVRPGLDIEVNDDSILTPYNITNGLWTMSKTQLTLHSSYPNAKIFSVNPNAVKPITKQKNGGVLFGEFDDESLLNFARDSLQRYDEGLDRSSENQADIFFEDIELKGSFITSVQMEYLQYDHTIITYDHSSHKFYILFLGNSTIGTALEYGDNPTLNASTMPKSLEETLKGLPNISPTDSLIYRLFSFLKESESHRHCLPWRWDKWDTLYSKMNDSILSRIPRQKSSNPEWKKKNGKVIKLKQKFERFRELQEQNWIEKFDLKRFQLAQLIPPRITQSFPPPHKELIYSRPVNCRTTGLPPPPSVDMFGGSPVHNYRPRGMKDLVRKTGHEYVPIDVIPSSSYLPPRRPRDGRVMLPPPRPRPMQQEIRTNLFDFVPSEEQEVSPIKSEPTKKMQVLRENKKMRPFCTTGSPQAIQVILDCIKRLSGQPNKKGMLLCLYDNLFLSILQIGVLAIAPQFDYTEKLEAIATHLISIIQDANSGTTADPEILSYAWRILINGWQSLVRTTERQSVMFQEAIKSEGFFNNNAMAAAETTGNWYYQVMLSPYTSPMRLFCMKHCQYPASFFLEYPIRQTNIQIFDVFEAVPEVEEKKGKGKQKQQGPAKLKFVESTQGKHDNAILEMCCEREVWPKLSGLLLKSSESMENQMMLTNDLTLDNVISYYSGVKVNADKSMPDDELAKHKRELVKKLREQHNERVDNNWKIIKKELLEEVNNPKCRLIWKAFNKLIAFAAEEVSAKGAEMIEFASKCFELQDALLAQFKELINGYKEVDEKSMPWIESYLEHLFWVSTMLHIGQGLPWETEYAVKIMPQVMALLSKLKDISSLNSDSARTLITSTGFSENVDYSYEKIFETPHPYGRGEFAMKDYAQFPGAIAICCEVDPRSHTEHSNDYLNIYTSEVMQNVYPGMGTTLRLSGRSSGRDKYILIGNKAAIEFRVSSQPKKKEEVTCRWGYKVLLRPIYGEPLSAFLKKEGEEQKFKQMLKINLPDKHLLQMLTSMNNLVALASRLISSLIKGIDLIPEEKNSQELFSLPIMREGLKFKHTPRLSFGNKKEVKSEPKEDKKGEVKSESSSPVIKEPKVYKFNRDAIEPSILRAIDDIESNTGWIISLITKLRQLVSAPTPYTVEIKRPSFEKHYRDKWALTERYVVLALIYHSRCEITGEGVQISESELQKIGQSLNSIIQWMLNQLMGEKDYFILRVSVLEECNKFYSKFREKRQEELRKRREDDQKAKILAQEEIKKKPEPKKKGKKANKATVQKSGASHKRKVKIEKAKKEKPEEEEPESPPQILPVKSEDIKISDLSEAEKKDFKQKLYQQVYDFFLQRYQGNFDLVKGLCNVLAIPYTAKDPAEALKKIFKKLQESLKNIIDFSNQDQLPENVDPAQLVAKSPYAIVAEHVIERAKFLFECKTLDKKPRIAQMPVPSTISKTEEGQHSSLLLPPLELQRTGSLQPFLQDAQTPEEMKKAVDSYLKWKRAKIAMDEELLTSDSPLKSVITVITSSTEPKVLKLIMKLQQKRGMLRALGLGYQYELMQKFNKTLFKRLIIGNATDSLIYGPFSYIEGSGSQVVGPITSHCLKLCNAIVETLREDCGKFKEIKRAVKKMAKKNPDNKGMDESCICEHMKKLLLVFSDLTTLLQGSTNNDIIINLCTSSTTKALSEFLSSIVDIILMSQSYSAELQSNPPIAKLNSFLISSCQVILNRFLASAQEISAPEAKSSIQQLLLQIFVDTLRRECGLSHPVKDAFLRFESPLYQLRFTQLLSFLYEILLIFEKITDIDGSLLQKCASLLCYLLHISAAPCIVRLASKCAQLLFKFIEVDTIQTEGIIPLPSITSDCAIAAAMKSPNNVVAHTLRRMGQFIMMKNISPASGVASKIKSGEYYVTMNINSSETEVAFVLTALYHWESLHPFFTECYPHELSVEGQNMKDTDYPGMFANTKLMQLSMNAKTAPKIFSAAMLQFEKQFEEIIKLTYEEVKAEDTEQEKMRKLQERNFNRRVKQHIQDAKLLTAYLLTRSYVQFPISLPYERAIELCDILDRAYNKQLEPIPLNPYMKPDAKAKKTASGVTIEASFPLTYKKPVKTGSNQNPPQPPIIIAKAQLVLSLCECNTFDKIEAYLDALSPHAVQNRHKATLEGVGLEIMQTPVVVGASFNLTIQELIQLLRSMLVPNSAVSWSKYITTYIQQALELLASKKWSELSEEDKEIILGCLILVGGWAKCVRPGTQVEALVNNNKAICTIVSGGYGTGKQSVTLIVKGDDNFVTHRIPLSQVKPFEEYKWPEDVALSDNLLIKAILNCHQQCQEFPKDQSLTMNQQVLKLLRVLMLKMSSTRNWSKTESVPEMSKFMDVLADLSKESSAEIIKANCEEMLMESWERLIENEDTSSRLFYVPKRQAKEIGGKDAPVVGKKGESKQFLEYVQPMSSYLKSLPGKLSDAHVGEEGALKLLNYWEKNLIPKIQDFVRSSYKPWENLYYFEQLRDRLRKGDMSKAMEEALEMCDRRLPAGCVPPDENQDWSSFISEECISGTWAKAKVQLKKGAQSSHPLVSRLIKQKINELTVLIKLADWRNQVALCIYTDLDTMQIYPMIFPINALKELECPLPLSPSSCSSQELLSDFVSHSKSLTTNCALKTLVALWASTPTFTPSFKQITIPEIVHWLVMDELSEDRVEGWLKLAPPLIELEDLNHRNEIKPSGKRQIIEKTLKNLNQRQYEENQKNNLIKIEMLMKKSIKSNKLDEIAMLHHWCMDAWVRVSQEISEYRVSMNLTEASDLYQKSDSLGICELSKGKDGNVIFPLHTSIIPKSDIGALIISFEMNAFLSPNSKLKFYSDPQGLNKVHQINVGKTNLQAIPPIVINDGKVWCHVHQGTIANLPLSVQEKASPSSLPCCVYFIPATWSTACWLTETLTTSLLTNSELKTIDIYYKPLIQTICECVTKSKAPSILKQLSFMLINRVLRKMRFVYNTNPYVPGSCVEKLGLNLEWLRSLIDELNKLRDNEDVGAESLYSEYIQNGAELISSTLLPFKSSAGVEEQIDTKLFSQLRIPSWLHSVLSVGIFLNYFRGEGQLTQELKQTVFDSLSIVDAQRKNLILLRNLPKFLTYPELRTAVLETLIKSKVRIVNPDFDIIIPKDELSPEPSSKAHAGVCVIIMDGFDVSLGEPTAKEEILGTSEAASQDQVIPGSEPAVESEPEQEELPHENVPMEWGCPACTFINPASSMACTMCGNEKPLVPILPSEPEVKPISITKKQTQEDKMKEDEEKELWKILAENLKMIGKKVEEVKEVKKEEAKQSKPEVKKDAKKEGKHEAKKIESLSMLIKPDTKPKHEEKKKEEKKVEVKPEEKKAEEKKVEVKPEEKKVEVKPEEKKVEVKPEEKKVEVKPEEKKPEEKKVEEKKAEEKKAEEKKTEEKVEVKKEATDEKKQEQKAIIEEPQIEVITNVLSGEMDRYVFSALKTRLNSAGPNEFSPEILATLEAIYRGMQAKPADKERIKLPRHEYLTNLGLLEESVPKMTLAEFVQAFSTLASCDPWLVWEFLAMQGYDLWCLKGGYSSLKEMPTTCNNSILEEVIQSCEIDICRETKSVMKMSPIHIRFAPIDKPPIKMINGIDELRLRMRHPRIFSQGLDFVRYNWALLKAFNENLIKAIPYINWTMCVNSIPENSIPLALSSFLSSARGICLNYVKICLQQAVLDQTAVPRERPQRLTFERLKLAKGSNRDKEGSPREDSSNKGNLLLESIFYLAYEQVKELDLTLLRPVKPLGAEPFLAFEIIFRGENVVGEGGPYRQFFADISAELQPSAISAGYTDTRSSALHLLCPTPNAKSKQGEGQDKYTFTPSAKSTTDLLLYEFLGVLMGCCIRTGVRLALDLPSIIWKQIVGEQLTMADLELVDKSVLSMIQFVTKPDLTPEYFNSTFTENFTALLSDETSVELIPNGINVNVTYDRRDEYAELLLKTRMTETTAQCKAVRKGISLIVPIALLNFLTYQEIEALVCGKPIVDIELLKRHARYSKGLSETSDRIKLFWEVLSEFSETDKLRFIKFCWGQERLPANDEEYERRQVRFMIKPSQRKGPNEEAALPKADTCFFNFELPNYKSKEVMKQRLLLAIHADNVSMNAEDNPALDPGSSGRVELEEDQE